MRRPLPAVLCPPPSPARTSCWSSAPLRWGLCTAAWTRPRVPRRCTSSWTPCGAARPGTTRSSSPTTTAGWLLAKCAWRSAPQPTQPSFTFLNSRIHFFVVRFSLEGKSGNQRFLSVGWVGGTCPEFDIRGLGRPRGGVGGTWVPQTVKSFLPDLRPIPPKSAFWLILGGNWNCDFRPGALHRTTV